MAKTNRFAPVSGAPSTLINVASGYFMLSGVLVALVAVLLPIFAPEGRAGYTTTQLAIAVALSAGWAAAMFWTGILIGRGSRRGGYLALGFTLVSLLSDQSGKTLAFIVLSLVVLASIWRDLK